MKIKSYRGAGVMLFRYNINSKCFEVLLGKRAVSKGYGQWAILGGRRERNDKDYYECALREFREESGVDLVNLNTQKLAVRRIDVPYYHWRTYLILTWGDFPELKKNWENSELLWFPVSAVSGLDLWISLDHEMKAFRKIAGRQGWGRDSHSKAEDVLQEKQ